MKTTIVPAQITTVEDRIVGNLTFSQLALLTAPIATSAILYVMVAPKLQLSVGKFLIMMLAFGMISPLALRVQGRTVVSWLVIYIRYAFRPRAYIHTKSDLAGRNVEIATVAPEVEEKTADLKIAQPLMQPISEQLQLKRLLEDPGVSVAFEFTQKGGIDVSLTPVKR